MGNMTPAIEVLTAERTRLAERLAGIDYALAVLTTPPVAQAVTIPVDLRVKYTDHPRRATPAPATDDDLPEALKKSGGGRRPTTQIAVWRVLNVGGQPMSRGEVVGIVRKMQGLSDTSSSAIDLALQAVRKKGLVLHDKINSTWQAVKSSVPLCEARTAAEPEPPQTVEVPPEVAKVNADRVAAVAASYAEEIARDAAPEPPRKVSTLPDDGKITCNVCGSVFTTIEDADLHAPKCTQEFKRSEIERLSKGLSNAQEPAKPKVQSIDIPAVLRREIDNKGTLTLQDAMGLTSASESEVTTHLRALCMRGLAECVEDGKRWQRTGDDRVLSACRQAMPGVDWRRQGQTWAGAATGQVTATLLLEQSGTDGAWGVFLARPGVPTNAGYGVTPGAACRALLSQMPRNGAGNFELKRSLMTRRTQ